MAVGRRGKLVRLRGYGRLDWDPESARVSPSSIYDMASITKVVGTTTAAMVLVDERRLALEAPVVRYLPWWSGAREDKEAVTVHQLLLHRGGLPPFRRFFLEIEGREAFQRAVADLALEYVPGDNTVYSDIGLMTIAWVVEEITGMPIDRFLEERAWEPLGMQDTGFLPRTGAPQPDRAHRDRRLVPKHARPRRGPRRERLCDGWCGWARGTVFVSARHRGVCTDDAGRGAGGRLRPGFTGWCPVQRAAVSRHADGECSHGNCFRAATRRDGKPGDRLGYAVGRLVFGTVLHVPRVWPHGVHGAFRLDRSGSRPLRRAAHEPGEPHPRQHEARSASESRSRSRGSGHHRPRGRAARWVRAARAFAAPGVETAGASAARGVP